MSKKHLVIVVFNFQGTHDSEALVKAVDRAIDWIQLTDSCWLLWTSSTSRKWLERFQRVLAEDDEVFISELNPADHALWMETSVSQFLQNKQARIQSQT